MTYKRSVISPMLRDYMFYLVLLCMPNMWKRQGLGGKVEMLRGKDLLMGSLKRIGLRYKRSLDLRSGFQVNFLLSSQRLVVIGCLTLQ